MTQEPTAPNQPSPALPDKVQVEEWVYALACLHKLVARVLPVGVPTRVRLMEELRELRNAVGAAGRGVTDRWPKVEEARVLLRRQPPPPRTEARVWERGVRD